MSETLNVVEQHNIAVALPGQEAQTARTVSEADLKRQYVSSRLNWGMAPILSTLPHAADDLSIEFGIEIYDRMKQDSEVAAALNMLVMAATSSKPRFVPATDTEGVVEPLSQQMADYLDWMINYSYTPFNEWRKALVEDALSYGSGIGEMQFDVVKSGKWQGFYAISDIHPLCVCEASFVVDAYDHIIGILPTKIPNMTFPMGAYIPLTPQTINEPERINRLNSVIPRSKFVIFTWNPKCGDPRGRSVLRAIYSAWFTKQQIINLMLDWFKKYSQPSIWGTTPPNAQTVCEVDANGNEIRIEPTQKLLEALLSFQNSSAIALPHGAEIHMLDMSGGGDIFLKTIAWANKEITRGIQMQHLATSDSEHMARASSGAHQDVLSLFILQLREWQAETIRRDIILPLVKANWGADKIHLAPTVDLGDGDGFPINATEIALLGQINWFTEEQKPKIDKVLGLPVRRAGAVSEGVANA